MVCKIANNTNTLQELAIKTDAVLEIHVRHFDHCIDSKAWRVQILWNGQTIGNSIEKERAVALRKANEVAILNVQKFASSQTNQLSKVDNYSAASTQTSLTTKEGKGALSFVKKMSKVASYVEIKFAETDTKNQKEGQDSEKSSDSGDEDIPVFLGLQGIVGKYLSPLLCALRVRSGSRLIASS